MHLGSSSSFTSAGLLYIVIKLNGQVNSIQHNDAHCVTGEKQS